jgi:tRNA(fMet)-specific endonuclease VapC
MTKYLLDTNHVTSAVRVGSSMLQRIEQELKRGVHVGTCVPVLCEVEAGRRKVARPDVYAKGLKSLLRMIRVWPVTVATSQHYGEIHQFLRSKGRVLSQVDVMLASLSRELNLVLVTTDQDFAALPWLKTVNWIP